MQRFVYGITRREFRPRSRSLSLSFFISLPRYPTSHDHRPRISPGRDCRESEAAVRARRDDDHDARGDAPGVAATLFSRPSCRDLCERCEFPQTCPRDLHVREQANSRQNDDSHPRGKRKRNGERRPFGDIGTFSSFARCRCFRPRTPFPLLLSFVAPKRNL